MVINFAMWHSSTMVKPSRLNLDDNVLSLSFGEQSGFLYETSKSIGSKGGSSRSSFIRGMHYSLHSLSVLNCFGAGLDA